MLAKLRQKAKGSHKMNINISLEKNANSSLKFELRKKSLFAL